MLYLYDNAIANDLRDSFNSVDGNGPVVKVIAPESIVALAAQMQNDKIEFPLVAVNRNPDTAIDNDRMNFTRLHKGVISVLDTETNELYYEKSIPVKLNYGLTVLTTNGPDLDEIVRELLFKYTDMYFLTITLPYEAKRQVRFGVTIDRDSNIEKSSGASEYIQSGTLYQAIVPIQCEGTVLVNYTPAKLRRTTHEVVAIDKTQK